MVRGHARLAGERLVEVHGADHSTRTLQATHSVVVTSGTTPKIPPVFQGIPVWESKDATGVKDVPTRLIIVGGGPVACEAATWMTALGSKVTMLIRGGLLLSGFEQFVSDVLTEELTTSGINIQYFTEATEVRRPEGIDHGLGEIKGGPITVRTNTNETLEAEELLLATGRRPNVESLNLQSVDLTTEDFFENRTPTWLHALGDASGKHQLTHMGKFQARQLVQRILGGKQGPDDQLRTGEAPTTQVVFTDPQIAFVGLTEDAAIEAGYDVVTAEADFADVIGAALLRDDVVGKAKIVVDKTTNCLIGATLMGPETAEMLHAATIAVASNIPVATLKRAIPVFPTASEIWVSLLEQLES